MQGQKACCALCAARPSRETRRVNRWSGTLRRPWIACRRCSSDDPVCCRVDVKEASNSGTTPVGSFSMRCTRGDVLEVTFDRTHRQDLHDGSVQTSHPGQGDFALTRLDGSATPARLSAVGPGKVSSGTA